MDKDVPKFVVVIHNEEYEIENWSESVAAVKAMEQHAKRFSDWTVAMGQEITVVVRDERGGETTWGVMGHMVPVYDSWRLD